MRKKKRHQNIFKTSNPKHKTENNISDKSEKLTKNDKLTLIIATTALVLTLLQLIFSIPVVSNLFYSANVIGERLEDKYSDKRYESTFVIKNNGNKAADNLLINMTIPKNSSFNIIPHTLYEIEERKNGEPLRDIIIKAPHFLPKENIYIIVYTDSSNYYKFMNGMDTIIFPILGLIKHDDGFGVTRKQ